MILPGETEASTAGTQPCAKGYPGGLIETMNGGVGTRSCAVLTSIGSKDPMP